VKLSAVLVSIGAGLVAPQVVWPFRLETPPLGMAPVMLGVIAVGAGLLVGLLRGTPTYRRAIGLGISGLAVALYGLMIWPRGRPGVPPSSINQGLVIFLLGIGICLFAAALAAVALWRARPPAHP
jgi:hypothetical protein